MLVVLDITLPVLSGYEVAKALRGRHGGSPPILAITADGRAAEKSRQLGAFTYLSKPFDVDDLLSAVRAGLRRGEPRDK